MKILFLTDISVKSGSWTGRYYPLIRELSNDDVEVYALVPCDRAADTKQERISDHCIVDYVGTSLKSDDPGRAHNTLKLMITSVKNLLLVLKIGLKTKFDIIFVGKPLPISATAAFILGRLKKRPIHLDCDDYEVFTNRTNGFIQRAVVNLFEDWFPAYCSTVSTHNQFLFRKIKKACREDKKVFFIPNGIDKERLTVKRRQDELSEPVNDGIDKILYFGDLNLYTGHNVDILIEALARIVKGHNRTNVCLYIVGDGRDLKTLIELAQELGVDSYIRWIGRVEPQEIANYIACANVVVDPVDLHPGNLSRCPLKILEAMYFAKPVVTSDIGDRKLILGDKGIYAKPGDPDDLADIILLVLDHRSLAKRLGDELKSLSEAYLWSTLAQEFRSVFDQSQLYLPQD